MRLALLCFTLSIFFGLERLIVLALGEPTGGLFMKAYARAACTYDASIVLAEFGGNSGCSECALRCAVAREACQAFSCNAGGACTLLRESAGGDDSSGCIGEAWLFHRGFRKGSSLQKHVTDDGRLFWIFHQRRSGSVSFSRSWAEYETGFGDGVDFWSGLKTLSSITAAVNATLRVEMTTLNGTLFVCEWSQFRVGSESSNYTMQYGEYLESRSNVSEDPLSYHKGMPFSTFDRDNDKLPDASCARIISNSGFWYNACARISPNSLYSTVDMSSGYYMSCRCIYNGAAYSTLKQMQMMLNLQ